MHFKTLLLSALLLLTIQSNAQKPVKFGNISPSDFKADYSSLDSNAHAIVLYEYGNVEFIYNNARGFEIETTIHVRKHILNKSSLDEGIVTIPYYRGTSTTGENIYKVKANTFNLEKGKVVTSELHRKEVFDERKNEDYYQKKMSLPDVKEGSIIEYTYVIQSPLAKISNPRTWYFQGELPKVWSEINVKIPAYFYYQIIMNGYLPLTVNDQLRESVDIHGTDVRIQGIAYRFAVADAPAFKDEKYITTEEDYISKVEFELSSYQFPNEPIRNFTTSWPELDKTLIDHEKWNVGFSKPGFLKEKVDEFNKISDMKTRLEAIHRYMTTEYVWDEHVGLGITNSLKKTFTDKTGSATELNLLASSLLRSCGFNANPVISSTRSNGRISEIYPLLDRFNYTLVVVHLGEEQILFDCTDPLEPLGNLPIRIANSTGREIFETGATFIDLSPKKASTLYEEINAKINTEEGSLSGRYNASYGGYEARDLRARFNEMGEKEFKESLIKSTSDWYIDEISHENMTEIYSSPSVSFHFKMEDGAIMPDIIYLTPMLAGQEKENPFKKKNRLYPVNLGNRHRHSVKASYEIPKGFVVDEMPKTVNVLLPNNGGSFLFHAQQMENTLVFTSRLYLEKHEYSAEEYSYLKQFYDMVVEKHAEQAVLKKIEE